MRCKCTQSSLAYLGSVISPKISLRTVSWFLSLPKVIWRWGILNHILCAACAILQLLAVAEFDDTPRVDELIQFECTCTIDDSNIVQLKKQELEKKISTNHAARTAMEIPRRFCKKYDFCMVLLECLSTRY